MTEIPGLIRLTAVITLVIAGVSCSSDHPAESKVVPVSEQKSVSGTLTVDANISKGTRFVFYSNDQPSSIQRKPVVAGQRTTYTFAIPDTLKTLRLDPSESPDANALIYSVTIDLPGKPKKSLPLNVLTKFLAYHCVLKMQDAAADVKATGPDMFLMSAVHPESYPAATAQ